MNRLSIFRLSLLICVVISNSACDFLLKSTDTSSSNSSTISVTDVSIPSYSKSALVVINTSVDLFDTEQSVGTLPRSLSLSTFTHPSLPQNSPCLNFRKKRTLLSAFNPRIQQRNQKIESLTAADTTAVFKTYNFETNSESTPLTINATLQYAGTHCLIYVETGINSLLIKDSAGHNTSLAVNWADFGKIFDEQIYPRETAIFGLPEDVDENGKTIIFYYAFNRGSIDENKDTGFIAGYFFPGDITPFSNTYSNRKDMLYMNIVCTSVSQNMETLAHEFKHLENYSDRVVNRGLPELDTWISEGLAECAAHIGLNNPLYSQISRMKTDSYIRNGKIPLLEWGQTAQQYAVAYTFFQYVKNQSSQGNAILGAIANHSFSDYRGIETLLTDESGSSFTNFKSILVGFHIANIVNQPTGPYGYKNDHAFDGFGELAAPSISSIKLGSGGAVYTYPSQSELTTYSPSGSGSNISFYRINP